MNGKLHVFNLHNGEAESLDTYSNREEMIKMFFSRVMELSKNFNLIVQDVVFEFEDGFDTPCELWSISFTGNEDANAESVNKKFLVKFEKLTSKEMNNKLEKQKRKTAR